MIQGQSALPWRMVSTQSTTREAKSFFEHLVEQDQQRLQTFFDSFEQSCRDQKIDLGKAAADPSFIDVATQIASQAEQTHEPAKLEALRNKLLATAKQQSKPAPQAKTA